MLRAILFASLAFVVAACVVIPLDEVQDDGVYTPPDNSCSGIRCGSGVCFPLSFKCDGDRDCADGSDELGCPSNMSCSGFACANGGCVSASYKCDGDRDCSDGSDELGCLPDLVVQTFSMKYEERGSLRYLCINQTPEGAAASNGDSVVVANRGSAYAGMYYVALGLQDVNSNLVYQFNGQLYLDLSQNARGQAPGTSVTWSGPYCTAGTSGFPPGTYRTVVMADHDEDVTESTETNNAAYSSDTRVIAAATPPPTQCTNTCSYAFDDICDDPGACAAGTDCTDCGGSCTDTCMFAFDDICDDPGACATGTDCSDCTGGSSSCTDTCQYANDSFCDDPGDCAPGTDCSDCE